ncbi:homodimerization region of STAR domain protein [Ditylenchus destructor]|nr:homodimerization region of STAR domain protein [Ditylenchus destructor]
MEYLQGLMREKEQLAMVAGSFPNLERLLDEEIDRVRKTALKCEFSNNSKPKLPEAVGEKVMLQDKVFVPIDDYPDYNFIGRILGPRGMTTKHLEFDTGCKIMIRGKGSMKDADKEEMCRGKSSYEHLSENLHILVQCEDTKERAKIKLENAVSQVRKILTPPVTKGVDSLKRRQLTELALLNGTYRNSIEQQEDCLTNPFPRLASFPPCTSQQRSLQQRNFSSPEWMFQTMPAFFNSPTCSPQESGDSLVLSPKGDNVPPGFNLNDVVTTISQQRLDSSPKSDLPQIPKKPWMDGFWRNGYIASDKVNANGFRKEEHGKFADGSSDAKKLFGGGKKQGSDIQCTALTCSGCGSLECL